LLWEQPTTDVGVASPATCRSTALARSPTGEDLRPGRGPHGARIGRGAYHGHAGRAPQGRGDCPTLAGGRGGGAGEHRGMPRPPTMGLPCSPGAPKHFPGESSGAEPCSASQEGASREPCSARKHSSPEPSGPGHRDFDVAEEEIRWVFEVTYRALHALWVVPSITSSSYPRALRTRTTPLNLGIPRTGGLPEQPGSGLVPMERRELGEENPANWVTWRAMYS
jgi:hypothetical protein